MSRAAAFDFILPRIKSGWKILDVGAGASPLAEMLAGKGCNVLAVDRNHQNLMAARTASKHPYEIKHGDLSTIDLPESHFDAAVAVYSLQHMIGYEPLVWCKIRRFLRPCGKLLYVGRYRQDSPVYEKDRADPLMSGDKHTIRMLGMLTGFNLVDFQHYHYKEDGFCMAEAINANAFGAELEAICL